MCVWLGHRESLDGTLSLSIHVVVIYGVVLLHVPLGRDAARRCVCGDNVKVEGPAAVHDRGTASGHGGAAALCGSAAAQGMKRYEE